MFVEANIKNIKSFQNIKVTLMPFENFPIGLYSLLLK